MKSVKVQGFDIEVECDKAVVYDVGQVLGVGVKVKVEKTDGNKGFEVGIGCSGQEVIAILNTSFGVIETETIISLVLFPYMLIETFPEYSSGLIISQNKKLFIGFLLPIQYKNLFSIAYSIIPHLPNPPITLYPQNLYPSIHQIFSALSGSTVCIGPGIFITNAHVVRKHQKSRIKGFNEVFKTIKVGKVLDLALIKGENVVEPVKIAERIWEKEKVYAVGFGLVNGNEILVTKGYLNKIIYVNGVPVLGMISAKTFNGQSGGGIFNEKKELIGIITSNAENVNDEVYESLSLCILFPAFASRSIPYSFDDIVLSYLWDYVDEKFAELFTFQTTTYLPTPKI
ncbi:hypothetical protein SteCoe_22824 [Stentor coeruleus]|uniref:Uncharacterized protein n=1 Tax=Stentor coeruleus TaxID=5963 RepID=A0A1R2BLE1_9CILI|nr:hypothetical protein SteCoe_22824 [Stentor coeruleus]